MTPLPRWPQVRATVASLVRRGPRTVILAGEGMRGGNHMYQWMLAHSLRRDNPQTFVRAVDNQAAWLEEFPALKELSLQPQEVRLTDRRSVRLGQGFGSDFTREELEDFCTARLLSSASFAQRLARMSEVITPRVVTVNVRRGDYYGTGFEHEFGMRIVPFVERALDVLGEREPVEAVQLVSDDLAWCARALAPLIRDRGVEVSCARPGRDMFDDLAALAVSRRLVLANSTFSYWGAYLATVRGTQPGEVVCPFFHQRGFGAARPWHHDPQWTVVPRIDGGWQEAAAAE